MSLLVNKSVCSLEYPERECISMPLQVQRNHRFLLSDEDATLGRDRRRAARAVKSHDSRVNVSCTTWTGVEDVAPTVGPSPGAERSGPVPRLKDALATSGTVVAGDAINTETQYADLLGQLGR